MDKQLSDHEQRIDEVLVQLLNYDRENQNWYYQQLQDLDMISEDYASYMISDPVEVDFELRRTIVSDFDLCKAMLTMLFHEEQCANGSFERRVERGDVKMVVEHMRFLLREKEREEEEKDLFWQMTDPEEVNRILLLNEGITLEEFQYKDEFVSYPKPDPERLKRRIES